MTQKTWGPFTGNHLTAIAGFIVLAIAVPGGLWAAEEFSNVAIYDPISGNTAVVEEKQLIVGDGGGALTVDGSVLARESAPSNLIRFYKSWDGNNNCVKIFTSAANTTSIIKSLFVSMRHFSGQPQIGEAHVFIGPNECQNGSFAFRIDIKYTETGVVALPVEPGFVVPKGSSLWIHTDRVTTIFGFGYKVPA